MQLKINSKITEQKSRTGLMEMILKYYIILLFFKML